MSKRKANRQNKFVLPSTGNIPPEKLRLPYNGNVVLDDGIAFSFACFDRGNKYFNLGGNSEDKTVGGIWFIKLLDCLKDVGTKTIQELKKAPYHLHPVKWESANVKPPNNSEQCQYWQFRLNKSDGRVIGILIDHIFYVVWLDPYHNLTNSEGYGGVKLYNPPSL
ncbi:MAG: hypothetical protein J6O04_04930 [Selenomonadaceae bacterium]|nr:hypothetical protein [Selenomonadaceae bacterium]